MRIRSIVPKFWRSDDIDTLDWHQRLVFIGLWSYVDDNGVGLDKVSSITADLFAHDFSVDPTETLRRVSLALNQLSLRGQITRYKSGGKAYLFINNWDQYQKPKNPAQPRYERPTCINAGSTEALPESSVEPTESLPTGEGEKGRRGEGLKRSSDPDGPDAIDLDATEDDYPDTFKTIYSRDFENWWRHYPRKDAKKTAFEAWKRAIKRASKDDLIAGAMRYADDPNREPRFTKQPSTWLNGDCWLSDQLPGPTGTTDGINW